MPVHHTKNFACYLIIALCLIFSCSKDIVFNEFQPVPDKVWDKHSSFLFHIDLKDASIPYDIFLQLRNNAYYPYQNLWILYEELHFNETIVNDTIEYLLAEKSGKWTGNGISLFQNQFPLKTNCHFPDTGKYTIGIRHGMYDDRLTGIEDIGLLVKKSSFLFPSRINPQKDEQQDRKPP